MRLKYILAAAASTLCAGHNIVTVSAGNDIVLTGVMSMGVLHLVSADQSTIDYARFLRVNKAVGENNEERAGEGAQKAKALVSQMFKSNSFSAHGRKAEIGVQLR
ncbi:secreted RxLR effector peptide protein, putative [Phytophthora infestans T30-4]|uniref:RxLR effector protein n=2 Tax=Phytophthora infestans TaxID=4787 RepID=D0N8W8_PHYIT|nr:secreted RxLR effector peptide protein, putative [Phytophthora infestans T30-4]EEY54003.1 secreted RxLR effector peptide protein, putative [Phytophthora infestans T30-4]KAF4134439.1 hypothetical protein GN958_ATG16374 [Phytophthora infestans]|eukprot:XP_002904634.1 secreted RxLR effector peptide protein, putative [Phytophthora infestans T30-4]